MRAGAPHELPPAFERPAVFRLLPIEEVHHGPGCIAGLGAALASRGIERALLVTGNTLATKTGLVEQVRDAAEGRIGGVFHQTVQHVHRGSVLRAAEDARRIGADGIVTFGGGSPNDTGKAVVLALAEGLRGEGDFDRYRIRFAYPARVEVPPVRGRALPLVAVSTTLSGGEFTHIAGITDGIRRVKDLYLDPQLCSSAVFLDAELTRETPEWLWLSSGVRAVDHCVEALCSTNAHPFVDALASRSLAMLGAHLRACKARPDDVTTRTRLQIAAWMSVCGLPNVNLGLSHGIGHQLGARNDVPHGVTSCVTLAPVMSFNRDRVGARQAWIAELLGAEVAGRSLDEAARAAPEAVRRLVRELGLPQRLRDVGVEPADFSAIAKDALEDMIVATNPRPVTSVEEVIEVLHSAY